jgi:hypothetical protein
MLCASTLTAPALLAENVEAEISAVEHRKVAVDCQVEIAGVASAVLTVREYAGERPAPAVHRHVARMDPDIRRVATGDRARSDLCVRHRQIPRKAHIDIAALALAASAQARNNRFRAGFAAIVHREIARGYDDCARVAGRLERARSDLAAVEHRDIAR